MSGAPKRLHDDGGHTAPLKRSLEDAGSVFPGISGKISQSLGNDFHPPYESGFDGRSVKIQRVDADKRSSLLPRMPPSSNNAGDHSIASDPRSELRSFKDMRDVRVDHRETKAEVGDNDVRVESKLDDKEIRSDRVLLGGIKGDGKLDKDMYASSSAYLIWKDNRENHRGKRYFDPANDGFDSWRAGSGRHTMQSADDIAREPPASEDWSGLEAREAVGENRVDLKGEEKLRDKERRRKDERHREYGERERDRGERRSNLLPLSAGSERKDLVREERDQDRWERDRKDISKEKERHDREVDSMKLDSSTVIEKDNLHRGKEVMDGPSHTPEVGNTKVDQKSVKDDSWKVHDRDLKDRKKEREADAGDRVELRMRSQDKELEDRLEPRMRSQDKELEDGSAGDRATERDNKEVLASGIQQRRRMIRTRGAPQTPTREPHFRSKSRENDGSQGKSESSAIVYKAGECVQELLKSWEEFEASSENKNEESSQKYPTLEVRIPAEYVTATNHQVRGGQLWGTDIYTNDSDLVAVLMHTGYCRPTANSPPPAIHELRATIRVLPPQDSYTSTLRNYVRSRAWGAGIGCSFRVERCCIVKKGGGTIELEPRLSHISAVEPTLAPTSVERTMTTRAAASNALRQQRFVREVTIQYNLCNEPWLKYSISVVADKGLKKPLYTSARLKKGEVLYLETHFNRYELCFSGEKSACNGVLPASSEAPELDYDKLPNHNSYAQNSDKNASERDNVVDVFRWARCKKPLPQNVTRAIGIPLPPDHLEVLEDGLCWEDIQWSQTGVWIAGKEYVLARAHFLSPN